MNFIVKYWRECVILLLLVAGVFGYKTWRREKAARVMAETNVAQAKVEMATFKDGLITQAKNELMKTQKELASTFSVEMQDELQDQKMKIMASIQTTVRAEFKAQGGVGKPTDKSAWTYSDTLMSFINVNAADPAKPEFKYQIAPLTLQLDGSLNFSNKKGVVTFWTEPHVIGAPQGIHLTVPSMTLTPNEDFIAWEASLRGKETHIPVMPKYSFSLMAGREWAKEFPGGVRTVYGGDFTRNYTNGLGIGGGYLGSTVFIKATYSFGKQ
jgi:hypothetical protein